MTCGVRHAPSSFVDHDRPANYYLDHILTRCSDRNMPRQNDSRSATRRDVIAGVSIGISSLVLRAEGASVEPTPNEISRSAESIHQEVNFKQGPERVYAALTDASVFQRVVELSGAVKSGMVSTSHSAQIHAAPGGAFSLFGGHISGRIIELLPNQRIVQAWRPADWAPGVYSVVKFELVKEGPGTRLVFDHTGFPVGLADHLAAGWKGNYWEPLSRVLASTP
jgi:activator of HSP90 ATPase